MSDFAQYSREVQAASDAAWKQQKAEIDALKQQLRDAQSALRAEREKALREAANVDWSTGKDVTDDAPKFLTDFQRGFISGQAAIRDAILALIGEKP